MGIIKIKKLEMQTDKPTLGYWKIRGLASNLRYQLKYSGVEFEMVEYQQGDAPDFDRSSWMNVKPTLGLGFPNVPYLTHGDFKMTETLAIHTYIAEVWKPELLGKTPQEKARAQMFWNVVFDLKVKTTMPCYTDGNKQTCLDAIAAGMPAIVKAMGDNKFLIGAEPVFTDFFFFEVLQSLINFSEGQVLKDFPTLDTYNKSFKELSGVKEYFADPACIDATYTFNNVVAKINGT